MSQQPSEQDEIKQAVLALNAAEAQVEEARRHLAALRLRYMKEPSRAIHMSDLLQHLEMADLGWLIKPEDADPRNAERMVDRLIPVGGRDPGQTPKDTVGGKVMSTLLGSHGGILTEIKCRSGETILVDGIWLTQGRWD